jgi:hypothetical protein
LRERERKKKKITLTIRSLACIAGWLATKHWFFVDILATAMAVQAVATLRLPNLLIATVLLCVFFLYDVFWVFLSPWLFGGKSVMVEVSFFSGVGLVVFWFLFAFFPT